METGDKVRVNSVGEHHGRTGAVAAYEAGGKMVEVEFDDESTTWHSFAEHELEIVD